MEKKCERAKLQTKYKKFMDFKDGAEFFLWDPLDNFGLLLAKPHVNVERINSASL